MAYLTFRLCIPNIKYGYSPALNEDESFSSDFDHWNSYSSQTPYLSLNQKVLV